MQQFKVVIVLAALAIAAMALWAQDNGADNAAKIDELQAQLDTLKAQMTDPEGVVQTNVSDVGKLKKITISGYAQLRLEDDESKFDPGKPAATNGDTRFNFNNRRVRVKVVGRPVDTTQVTFQWDMSDSKLPGSTFTVKDAMIDYFFRGDPSIGYTASIGQFAIPFGYLNPASSSTMDTPERPKIITKLFPDEYDRGLKFSTATNDDIYGDLALISGSGQSTTDTSQNKNLVARVRARPLENLDCGISAYMGGKDFVSGTTYKIKQRFGVDAQYYLEDLNIKAEAICANDQGAHKSGFYLESAYNITKNDAIVGMIDAFNDPTAKNPTTTLTGSGKLLGNQLAYTLGLNHFLDTNTKLRLFYEIDAQQKNGYHANSARFEVLSTF